MKEYQKCAREMLDFIEKSPTCFQAVANLKAVHPGRQNHAAIFFRIQLYIDSLHRHLRGLLDLKTGRIAVGCTDMESLNPAPVCRQAESDQRGVISCDKI